MKWLLIITVIGLGTDNYKMQLDYNTKSQCEEALKEITSGLEKTQIKDIRCVSVPD